MKDIAFSKDGNTFIFNFYFKNNAHILMSILGGAMIFTFALFYLFKPYFKINDESYFLFTFFFASIISLHLYGRY
jgi:hypothetical protein